MLIQSDALDLSDLGYNHVFEQIFQVCPAPPGPGPAAGWLAGWLAG
jgi:hypothetical protein